MMATKALPEMEAESEQVAVEHQARMGARSVSDQMQESEVCIIIPMSKTIFSAMILIVHHHNSPGGGNLITACQPGLSRLWNTSPLQLLMLLCRQHMRIVIKCFVITSALQSITVLLLAGMQALVLFLY